MRRLIVPAIAGIVFAIGLLISGMTVPANVTAFLDVGGAWDPTLAFVMGSAIAVFAPFAWLARRREAPFFAEKFVWPTLKVIDVRLVGGAAIFGVGWGISGYCPGPALVSAASSLTVFGFVAAMVVGSQLAARV
jgi:hypothetical protein